MAELLRSKVEEHLTCSICLEQLKDPKVLPCLHSFCHVCLVNLAKEGKSKNINCPDCRLAVEVNEDTISTLPSNFFVNNLLATLTLTNDKADAKISCDSCDVNDGAQSRCNDCGMFLCQFCTESHKRFRSTKLHKLLTIEELKSNTDPQIIAEKIKCSKHKDEVLKLFCKTCQTTICRDCTIVDHQGHKYAFVEDVAEEEKQNLQESLDEVKEKKDKLEEGILNLKKCKENMEARKTSTIAEINNKFDLLVRDVETRRSKLVEKANLLIGSKQKQINCQLEVLEMAYASCQSSIEFTKQAIKNGNDVQILSLEKYILESLEQLKMVQDQTEVYVTEHLNFITLGHDKKTELLDEYDVNIVATDSNNCHANFREFGLFYQPEKLYSIELFCKDNHDQRIRTGGDVIVTLFSGVEVDDVTVTDNMDGSYKITFRPCWEGMLK